MTQFEEQIKALISDRIESAYDNLKDEPEFKTLRLDILGLQQHIRKALPSGLKNLFEEYCEMSNERESAMAEQVYRTGFADGAATHTHNME